MKANELMVGDWVLINGVPKKIQAVDGVDDEIMADDEMLCLAEDRYHSEDKATGIHLTPEILKKNGWKKDSGGEECWANSKAWFTPHEYGKRDTIKSWEVEICGKPNSFDGVIKYVHELQQALRLCGIKKQIEL